MNTSPLLTRLPSNKRSHSPELDPALTSRSQRDQWQDGDSFDDILPVSATSSASRSKPKPKPKASIKTSFNLTSQHDAISTSSPSMHHPVKPPPTRRRLNPPIPRPSPSGPTRAPPASAPARPTAIASASPPPKPALQPRSRPTRAAAKPKSIYTPPALHRSRKPAPPAPPRTPAEPVTTASVLPDDAAPTAVRAASASPPVRISQISMASSPPILPVLFHFAPIQSPPRRVGLPSPAQSVPEAERSLTAPAVADAPFEGAVVPGEPGPGTEEGPVPAAGPDVASFLASLAIPLLHLLPAFEGLGCTTALDLQALAARTKLGERLRASLLDAVACDPSTQPATPGTPAGIPPKRMSRWDRIMLEEGLRELGEQQ